MKKKKITCIIGAVAIMAVLSNAYFLEDNYKISAHAATTTESTTESSVKFVIDTENKAVLPKNFRTTNDTIDSTTAGNISLKGFSELNISGSGALSEKGLEAIKAKVGNKHIIDVDLRQESHGFLNGMSISWYGINGTTGIGDQANKGLTRDQVLSDEKEKLHIISKTNPVTFDHLAEGKSINTISEISNPKVVETEEKLAKNLGIGYLRITATDHEKPSDDQVDLFVKSIKKIPDGTWLHFHCRGGDGRTTSFMSMYDMMHNAKNVSFEDIMNRQNLIGGSDLLTSVDKDGTQTRKEFLEKFYNYCKDNNDGFKTSWSKWLKKTK